MFWANTNGTQKSYSFNDSLQATCNWSQVSLQMLWPALLLELEEVSPAWLVAIQRWEGLSQHFVLPLPHHGDMQTCEVENPHFLEAKQLTKQQTVAAVSLEWNQPFPLTASVERTHSFHPHCPRRSNHSTKHTFILLGYATNNYLLDNISTLLKEYFCLMIGHQWTQNICWW